MPPRSKPQGESKQGLIITLVFFILATIGLGVATYFGFDDKEKIAKERDTAKKDVDLFKAERDNYKYQAQVLYSFIGMSDGMEDVDTLGTRKDQFDKGTIKGKDRAFAEKKLKDLEKQLGWNGNAPKETLEGAITKLNTELQNRATQIAQLRGDVAKKTKELEAKDDELQTARADFDKKLKDLQTSLKGDFTKSNKDLDDLRKSYETFRVARDKEKEDAAKEKKALEGEIAQLKTKEIKSLKEKIKDQQDRLDSYAAKTEQAPATMRTDWKIIRMDTRGTNPYINLGSSDHVQPQLTFTVHGVGPDGHPNPRPKGTMEVVRVIGPHLSQTRITSVKDRNRDPIIEGDVIYNASWNPTLKKHVAIAGIIDLAGDGRDNLSEFMRNLERQNIVVDAYQDPKDGTMHGKINFRTDYLILGDVPDPTGGGKAGKGAEGVLLGRKLMQEEAKKYGVPSIGFVRYLDMIGYPLPHSGKDERPSLYNPDLRPDQAPRLGGDKAPPPMPPDRVPPAMPPDK